MISNEKTHLNDFGVHLTGSITSNQYTPESDIDIHFYSDEIPKDNAEEFTKMFKKVFEDEFKTSHSEYEWHIANHPIEVYFQSNRFQDYMSVGCYDVVNEFWLVGPELKPLDYDPYSDLYNQDMKHVHGVIGDIRNIILECFETAIAIKNSNDENFKNYEFDHLKQRMTTAAKIFKDAQNYRKVYSAPQSMEQAKMFRDSRKWKIADSSFKLLDKFGYLKILRMLTQQYEGFQNGNDVSRNDVVETVIHEIKDNFSNNKYLGEEEIAVFKELDESIARRLSELAVIASMLAIPGVTNARTLERNLNSLPSAELKIDSVKVSDAITKSQNSDKNVKYNGLSKSNLINLVATILYNESMTDYLRSGRNEDCIKAIGNVIENRANKDPNHFVDEISRKSQFVSFKNVKGGVKDSDYSTYYPYLGNIDCWNLCVRFASQMIDGKLENVIGNCNMIANPKDVKSAKDSWGKDALVKVGGENTKNSFGYQKDQDGSIRYGGKKSNATVRKVNDVAKTVVVKKGDTIGKIAKNNNVSVKTILDKNPNIKNADFIKIG